MFNAHTLPTIALVDFKPSPEFLTTSASTILASEHAKADKATIATIKTHAGHVKPGESVTITTTVTTTQVVTKSKNTNDPMNRYARPHDVNISAGHQPPNGYGHMPNGQAPMEPGWAGIPPLSPVQSPLASPRFPAYNDLPLPPPLDLGQPLLPPLPSANDVLPEDNSVVVGLKVYTKKTAPTVITGRLKLPSDRSAPPAPARYS